jgi:hypothetical protein
MTHIETTEATDAINKNAKVSQADAAQLVIGN